MSSRKVEPGYRNQSTSPKVWTPVVNPAPVFASPEETRAYQGAVATVKRLPGEDVCDYLERVNAQAKAPQGRLPYRETGEEG